MPFSIDICNRILQLEEKKTCFNASVHRFRSRSLFSFFLPPHAHSELYDLLCPLFLLFRLKLWVINLVSQHLQELLGRRRKLWWTQFSPAAQHQILSWARLTSSLLTHPNLEEHNGDGYFSVKELYTQIPLKNIYICTAQKLCLYWSTEWLLFCILFTVFFVRLNLHFLPHFGGSGSAPSWHPVSWHTDQRRDTFRYQILETSLNCTEKQIDT